MEQVPSNKQGNLTIQLELGLIFEREVLICPVTDPFFHFLKNPKPVVCSLTKWFQVKTQVVETRLKGQHSVRQSIRKDILTFSIKIAVEKT